MKAYHHCAIEGLANASFSSKLPPFPCHEEEKKKGKGEQSIMTAYGFGLAFQQTSDVR